LKSAESLDSTDQSAVEQFVAKVKQESETTLATLDGLEEEIKDLQSKGDEIRSREVTLEMLDEKYQKHFDSYQRRQNVGDRT
jgi:cell division protein FtsB